MKNKKKNFFNLSNGITGLMILFIITMLIVPGVKSSVIQGLMNIGLFQPDISDNQENKTLVANSVAFKGQDGETIYLNDLKGKVIDELEKGYYLNDKVIRFAKVIIGS